MNFWEGRENLHYWMDIKVIQELVEIPIRRAPTCFYCDIVSLEPHSLVTQRPRTRDILASLCISGAGRGFNACSVFCAAATLNTIKSKNTASVGFFMLGLQTHDDDLAREPIITLGDGRECCLALSGVETPHQLPTLDWAMTRSSGGLPFLSQNRKSDYF